MTVHGFYQIKQEYIELIAKIGGTYRDQKERPIFCCVQDKNNPNIYWGIPTSDIAHREAKQLERIKRYCDLPARDIRSCFYHIGHTNRPAIFKISNVLPLTEKYIDHEYISQGEHLFLKNEALLAEIQRKLSRILFAEQKQPNKYEQHITDIYNHLENEMKLEEKQNRDSTAQVEEEEYDLGI